MTESKNNQNPEQDIEHPAAPAAEDAQPTADSAENVSEVEAEAQNDNAELFQKLDEALKLAEEYKQKYLLAVADLDNYRKRAQREKDEARRYGASSLIEDLLPVMDNMGFGLLAANNAPEAKAIADGLQMVMTQLKNTLGQHGVEELDPLGQEFDPNLHDAVATQADENVPEHHIITVQRKGYRLRDRLLRPAAVIVSQGAQAAEEEA